MWISVRTVSIGAALVVLATATDASAWWCATNFHNRSDQVCRTTEDECGSMVNASTSDYMDCREVEIVSIFEFTQVNGGRMFMAFPLLSQCERQRKVMMKNKIDYKNFSKCYSSDRLATANAKSQDEPPRTASVEGILLAPDENGCQAMVSGHSEVGGRVTTHDSPPTDNLWFCSAPTGEYMTCINLPADGDPDQVQKSAANKGGYVLFVVEPNVGPTWLRIFGQEAKTWESKREMLVISKQRYHLRTEAFVGRSEERPGLSFIKSCVGEVSVPEAPQMKRLWDTLTRALAHEARRVEATK